MSDLHVYITLTVFATVILAIAFNVIDMALAALLGVSVLIALGILNEPDIMDATRTAGGPLSLLFGGMVVARTLSTTGLFERMGDVYLRATRGSGRRFLLLLVALVAPLCAFLPNATAVILLAPVIIRVAVALEVDFVGPMVVTAIVSNAAGLLTLVGDPATFLVGSSIGMSFGQYLRKVSLGGLMSLLVLIPLLPLLMPDLWHMRRPLPPEQPAKPLERPGFAALALAVLAVMVVLFLFGEDLPTRIVPPAVAIIAASLALLVVYETKVEPVDNLFHDIDWKTLIFLGGIFCLVQAVTKTGLLQRLALKLHLWFGSELTLVAGDDRGDRRAVEPARQHPGGRGLDSDDQGLPGGSGGGARGGARSPLRRLARSHHSGLRRDDVRRDAWRERHAHRSLRQRRRRRHMRAARQAGHVRQVPALRPSDHRRPARGVRAVRPGAVPADALIGDHLKQRLR